MIFNWFCKGKKVGLVLGGGGSKGAAHIAVLEELERLNVRIDVISGTSIGALVAAYYAVYGEVETLKTEIFGYQRRDWFRFADFSKLPRKSLVKGVVFRDFLERVFGDKNFSDTKIPLVISVSNLDSGRVEYIKSGKVVDAILASTAYPGVFPPLEKNGSLYVDGGVLDNVPFLPILERNLSKIIVVDIGGSSFNNDSNNIINTITRSIDLMMRNNSFDKLRDGDKRLFVLRPVFDKSFGSMWDFTNLDKKYNSGKREFSRKKDELLSWLKS